MSVNDYLSEVKIICDTILQEEIYLLIRYILDIKRNKGRIFFLGVGGSAANASHAVNDFRKILDVESYSVSDNVSELTARINDISWQSSYRDWLKGSRLSANDAIFILSVGGGSDTTSVNLCYAIDYAKSLGSKILGIVSRDGGYAKTMADACVIIPVVNVDRITPHAEEWQGIIWHLVVTLITEMSSA